MFYRVVFASVGLATLIACATCPNPRPCVEQPAKPPLEPATCASACQHFRDLGCKEGHPTAEGNTCEGICDYYEQSGVVQLDLECVVRAHDCFTAGACPVAVISPAANSVIDAAGHHED